MAKFFSITFGEISVVADIPVKTTKPSGAAPDGFALTTKCSSKQNT